MIEIVKEKDLESAINEFNKFKTRLRVSITANCNLDCNFCHREGLDSYSSKRNMNVTDNISGVVSDEKGILATPKNRVLILKIIGGLTIRYEPKHQAHRSSLRIMNGKTIGGLI